MLNFDYISGGKGDFLKIIFGHNFLKNIGLEKNHPTWLNNKHFL